MRVVFAIIGLLFDVAILAAAGFSLYCVLQPDFFYYALDYVGEYYDMDYARVKIAGIALGLLILSFRSVFLLLMGKSDVTFVIRRGENGVLSVSRSTLEQLIGQLAEKLLPPAEVQSLKIVQSDKGLKIDLKIRLDLSNCNLGEYSKTLDSSIRAYFKESLGVDVDKMDIKAVASPTTKAQPPAPAGEV